MSDVHGLLHCAMTKATGNAPGWSPRCAPERVLEIGSGGYDAALLSELVGDDGEITSVDIDAEVVERARHTARTPTTSERV